CLSPNTSQGLAVDNILALNNLLFLSLLEYAAINSMLDQISSCLDHLEEKNDHLHACLKELLESNRQTRLEFQQQSDAQPFTSMFCFP
uniref:Uncharacterized protein n=1 Tax=Phasianus colchicus TaxID=9054 RepID=A0A669Q8R3_PHACC